MKNTTKKEWELQDRRILAEILAERRRQVEKFGVQDVPIKPADQRLMFVTLLSMARHDCEVATKEGTLTYYHIAAEGFFESFSEDFPMRQREELVQLAAVIVQAIERIDRLPVIASAPLLPENAPVECPCTSGCGMHCSSCEI